MVALPDGRVLLFGGQDQSGKALSDTWIFRPEVGAQKTSRLGGRLLAPLPGSYHKPALADWTPITPPDSPAARQGHSMVTLPDGRVLLYGGSDTQGTWFNDLNLFTEDKWSPITPGNNPPSARAIHNAWLGTNKMYILGGQGKAGLVEDFWLFDLQTNAWQQLPKPPDFISPNARPAVIGDKAFLLDPQLMAGAGAVVQIFDMKQGRWEQRKLTGEPPPGQRSGYAMVQVDSNAYMLGGGIWNPNTSVLSYTAEFWRIDLNTLAWTRLDDIPNPVYRASVVLVSSPPAACLSVWGGQEDDGVLVPGNKLALNCSF